MSGTKSEDTKQDSKKDGSNISPVLEDWTKYRNSLETLSEFSKCKLQIMEITVGKAAIKMKLHDSKVWISAILDESYRSEAKFLSPNSVVDVLVTSGGPADLRIVSFVVIFIILD